jgi:hypothetical protein
MLYGSYFLKELLVSILTFFLNLKEPPILFEGIFQNLDRTSSFVADSILHMVRLPVLGFSKNNS